MPLHYNVTLPENVNDILDKDFWLFDDLSDEMLETVLGPVKFTSSCSIFVRSGEFKADINLAPWHVKAPCLVNIRSNQILQKDFVSPDFHASFIVMSKRLVDNILMTIDDAHVFALASRCPVVPLSTQDAQLFSNFYASMRNIVATRDNPYLYNTILHTLVAFFWRTASSLYSEALNSDLSRSARLPDRFLALVQKHFKTERFLDFYAAQLGITPKHLSRSIKRLTGITAVQWIERYVVLEAKVLLKSSTLTIQQISDELNFPSQSFFGKYFKKAVGLSPRDFRNFG